MINLKMIKISTTIIKEIKQITIKDKMIMVTIKMIVTIEETLKIMIEIIEITKITEDIITRKIKVTTKEINNIKIIKPKEISIIKQKEISITQEVEEDKDLITKIEIHLQIPGSSAKDNQDNKTEEEAEDLEVEITPEVNLDNLDLKFNKNSKSNHKNNQPQSKSKKVNK